ncbi:adenosine deaminase [Nitrosomonas cryotolerans]|uniref:adenosine deaminase n=2 Tax=Nitrosomonas cryotolerans TaxID=44575 RepID=A0A1N6FZK4_9PROT|nr:adenosine deaminase [Nitrosomonas cryotolerans]SIO00632.1 adenosine deaminase [Nitrosomonas cryotolerans ATCC 49181]
MGSCASIGHHTDATEGNNFQQTNQLYDDMLNKAGKANIAQLNLFFTNMPKGGDIHHHYTGSIYAETYLDWVKQENWFIDKCTFKIVMPSETSKCELLTVDALIKDNESYRKLLTLWSDKDYGNHFHDQPPPDSAFFNTFDYFGPISNENMDIGINIIKQRAIKENVSYIETMLTRVGVKSKSYFDPEKINNLNITLRNASTQAEVNTILNKVTGQLSENSEFGAAISNYVSMIDTLHQGIDNDLFMMRYQTYAARVVDPLSVFMDLYAGYLAAERSPFVVGVNIVAPENNHIALSDYTLHMQMFNYLHSLYPNVNRALHAGELTTGMVRPKDLLFHIKQARDIAKAQRIGHGIGLPYEQDSLELLEDLKQNAAIEINLTSNQFILGVKGNEHPYLIYSSYGVPLVISTDDSGVSRNNLTQEYVLLASRYKPSYGKIKEYVYNSIRYSFLSSADKITAITLLDKKFVKFESEMATLYGKLN